MPTKEGPTPRELVGQLQQVQTAVRVRERQREQEQPGTIDYEMAELRYVHELHVCERLRKTILNRYQ
jgi:hypothetical protein